MFYKIFRNVSASDVLDFPKDTILEFFELTEKRNTNTQSIGSDAENQVYPTTGCIKITL